MSIDERALVSALRDDLQAAGYSAAAVRELWGDAADDAIVRGQLLPARRAIEVDPADSALRVLASLFILGETVSLDRLAAALPNLGAQRASALGLIEITDAGARAICSLRSHTFVADDGAVSWWIASDLDEAMTRQPLRADHVVGVGGASLTLLGLQPTERVATVLDLGTGCGIQTLLASRYADRVIATDVSERALRFARLNAELNGVRNAEFRLGDLFEPIAGETVDRLVSNPPFVVTPRVDGVPLLEYRDGGRSGDDLMTTLIAELAEHLVPGGTAVLLGNWEYHVDRDGLERMRLATASAGLDAWVVERDVLTASQYAETWIRDGGVLARTPRFDELYAAWLEDLAVRDVDRIGLGYLILRRPHGNAPTLSRFERLHGALGASESGLSAHITACIAAHDWQVALSDAELLRARLVVAADVTEQRHYWPGDAHPAVIDLRQGGGFGRTVEIDTALAGFVGACDGELEAGAISDAVAQLLEGDPEALRAELVPRIRDLVDIGILLPAED